MVSFSGVGSALKGARFLLRLCAHFPSPFCDFHARISIHYPTRSGPKRPAAAIGGGDFLGYMGKLKLVDRRLEFHRNSGFFQANFSRLFWPPFGLGG